MIARHTVTILSEQRGPQMTQGNLHKIKAARQRSVLCRLMIDIMRSLHGAYAPTTEPLAARRIAACPFRACRAVIDG
jgi:hypothetical protein